MARVGPTAIEPGEKLTPHRQEPGYNPHFLHNGFRGPPQMQIGTVWAVQVASKTDHRLREFLSLCPAVILGRHIAITWPVDSGCFKPSEADPRPPGWRSAGGIAYSPRHGVRSPCCLPPVAVAIAADLTSGMSSETEPSKLGSICHANGF